MKTNVNEMCSLHDRLNNNYEDMRLFVLAAVVLLSTFADSHTSFAAFNTIHHNVHNSFVLAPSYALAIAANDAAITRFAYDDHRVTRAETLIGSAVFDVAF